MTWRTPPAHICSGRRLGLTLREGAAPFRSLGRISIRPRSYQFVPLLMALRLDPVRLLIADDVGVGKTIEALLIARELLDRGEIRRLCVVCPPSLCEQWQSELAEKFNLDAVVIRSGTVGQLERRKPISESLYRHYPCQVASIDFLKTDRNRHAFLQDCPEIVIVDCWRSGENAFFCTAIEGLIDDVVDLGLEMATRKGTSVAT